MAKIAFYKGNKVSKPLLLLGDWAIRLWTLGKYSHCEIIDDREDRWIWYSSSSRDGGVRGKVIKHNPKHWDIFEIQTISDVGENRGFQAFSYQLGKKYDWLGIFLTQFINLNRHNVDKWFCSEICHSFLERANIQDCPTKNSHEYSPNSLYRHLIKNRIIVDDHK